MKKSNPRLKRIPAPKPGVVIVIPLDLYPEYMQLHGYEPAGYRNGVLTIKKGEPDGPQKN